MDDKRITEYMLRKRYIEDKYVCWDFVMDVFMDCKGIKLPEYPIGEVQVEFREKISSNFPHVKVPIGELKKWDIVVFSLFANQHAGVMISDTNYIHLSRGGVEVGDLNALAKNYKGYRIL